MAKLQLRMYTLNKGQAEPFLKLWRQKVVPLRATYGFRVVGSWLFENENRFVWMLAYDGDDWDKAEAAYFGSDERKTMNPSPSDYVAHMELRFVQAVSSTEE